VSRRGLLIGGAVVVLAGGAGVAVGARRQPGPDEPVGRPPADLVSALNAEIALIATIDATTGGTGPIRAVMRQIRAEHVAHRAALEAAVAAYPQGPLGTPPAGTARAVDVAGLRSAEELASSRAAARAVRLTGNQAVLLASIAASEASHAELFQ
jgi:hypothetical protein